MKDFKESVKEYKLLDKILPDFNLLKGIQVLVSPSGHLNSPEKGGYKKTE